jgi:hypothetical protein
MVSMVPDKLIECPGPPDWVRFIIKVAALVLYNPIVSWKVPLAVMARVFATALKAAELVSVKLYRVAPRTVPSPHWNKKLESGMVKVLGVVIASYWAGVGVGLSA